MSEEVLVNVAPMETRVAVVDNGAIQDIHIERASSRGIVGNIYAGKVVRVLPGMQAAFVDIGTERTSFIHVSDILEAATTLARQLRLRNPGGIIIVDFIDMQDQEHQRQVHRTLEKAMHRDPVRNKITGVSELGLVEMTRKRTRESLEHILCEDCPVCEGRGVLKTAESVCYEIFREITRDARAYENDTPMVLAAQAVVDRLLDEESTNVADLEEFVGKTISFRVEPTYSQEHFDIVLL